MKKLSILLLLIITSCKTSFPISTYLKNEEINSPTILVGEDKIESKEIFSNLKYKLKMDSINKVQNNLTSFYLKIILKSKNNVNEKWKVSDYDNLNSIIFYESNQENIYNNKNKYIKDGLRKFYSFSNPIYSDNKDLCVFYVSKADGWNVQFSGVITMEMKDKKWKVIDIIENPELH